MKRISVFLIVVISILLIAAFASAETYIVNTEQDPLNIRSVEDSSIILGGIKKGKTVNIDYHDKFWGYFTYNGIPAKVYMDYLIPASGYTPPTEPHSTKSSKKTTVVEATPEYVTVDEATLIYHVTPSIQSHINVRDAKRESAKVIGRLEPNDEVYVVAIGKTWARIVYNNQYGFVYAKYLIDCGDNLPEGGELYQVKVRKNTTLNVRKEDKQRSKVVTKLRNGAFVKVFEKQENWSFVYFTKTDFGYVMNKFIVPVE